VTHQTEPDPSDEWFYEDEIDGCLHGVPWDQDCWECEVEEDRLDMGVL